MLKGWFFFLHLPESLRLQQDLEKVQQLEGKITCELSTLKEQISTMESELRTYRDLETLRRTAEEKKKVSSTVCGEQAKSSWSFSSKLTDFGCRNWWRNEHLWLCNKIHSSSCWRRRTRHMKLWRPNCRRTRLMLRLEQFKTWTLKHFQYISSSSHVSILVYYVHILNTWFKESPTEKICFVCICVVF